MEQPAKNKRKTGRPQLIEGEDLQLIEHLALQCSWSVPCVHRRFVRATKIDVGKRTIYRRLKELEKEHDRIIKCDRKIF